MEHGGRAEEGLGVEQARFEMRLPPEVPYGFATLPQYDTERIIEEHLARFGTGIERGTELLGFTQDEDGVVSRIVTASGRPEEPRSRFLVGCDGAHSTVRKGLGLTFEGGRVPGGVPARRRGGGLERS